MVDQLKEHINCCNYLEDFYTNLHIHLPPVPEVDSVVKPLLVSTGLVFEERKASVTVPLPW